MQNRIPDMKKLFFLLLFAALTAAVQAKSPKDGTVEPRVRFGVGYRYSLGLYESAGVKYQGVRVSSGGSPDYRRGGEFLLEGTVRVTGDWNVGLGFGFGSWSKGSYKSMPLYVKAERLYGRQRNRWFNYANAGLTLYPDYGTGFTGGIGGGYRIAVTRRTRLDLTVGFDYVNVVGDAYDYSVGEIYSNAGRINRLGLAFGVAMHF